MDRHQWLAEIAALIADGQTIDWPSVEARVGDDPDIEIIRRLQSIERLTQVQSVISLALPPEEMQKSWGHLQIKELLGRGAHGDVYRAYDSRLDRDVALKLLRSRQLSAHSAVIDEARLMAKVRHPSVVVVYGADAIRGRTGIWMELIEGKSLDATVKSSGPLSADEVVRIGIELCGAVIAIAKAGLLHRDVKAQNVVLESTGRVVLTDFGVGLELDDTGEGLGTNLVGTPAYLAPEVLAGRGHSGATEVYALGTLLHYLASGTFPVKGGSIERIRHAHETTSSITVAHAAPRLPVEIAASIDSALERDPEKRYSSASRFRRALRAAQSLRTTRLSGFALSLVSSPLQRKRIAARLLGLTVDAQLRKPGFQRELFRFASLIRLGCAVLVGGLSEIRLIPAAWAARAYVCLAAIPGLAIFMSSWVFFPTGPSPRVGAATISLAVVLWSTRAWEAFLPLSFFYAVAIPFGSQKPPISALALAGGAFAMLLRIVVDPVAILTYRIAEEDTGLAALWPGIWSFPNAIARMSWGLPWPIAASQLGSALLVPAMVVIAAQLDRGHSRRRVLLLWSMPALFILGMLGSRVLAMQIAVLNYWPLSKVSFGLGPWLLAVIILAVSFLAKWRESDETSSSDDED